MIIPRSGHTCLLGNSADYFGKHSGGKGEVSQGRAKRTEGNNELLCKIKSFDFEVSQGLKGWPRGDRKCEEVSGQMLFSRHRPP